MRIQLMPAMVMFAMASFVPSAAAQRVLKVFEGRRADERFGVSVAHAGDHNGDGVQDVVMGAPGSPDDPNAVGRAYVHAVDGAWSFYWHIENDPPGTRFGQVVRLYGDEDGDGQDELLVSAPGHDGKRGLVAVASMTNPRVVEGPAGTDHEFGTTLASGADFNGDQVNDVIVGSRRGSQGEITFYSGPLSSQVFAQIGTSGSSTEHFEALGESLAFAPLRANENAQVLVSSPGHRSSIATGIPLPTGHTGLYTFANPSFSVSARSTGHASGARHGLRVAFAGDVDGDGTQDLLVAAIEPRQSSSNNHRVEVRTPTGTLVFTHTNLPRVGALCGVGDQDGDGRDDYAIGFPTDADAGSVVVYSGMTHREIFRYTGQAVGDELGASLASVPDVTGDGLRELLVGAPKRDVNGMTDAGSAYLLSGSRPTRPLTGLTSIGPDVFVGRAGEIGRSTLTSGTLGPEVRFSTGTWGSIDDFAVSSSTELIGVCAEAGVIVTVTNPRSANPTVTTRSAPGIEPRCVVTSNLDQFGGTDVLIGCAGDLFGNGAGLWLSYDGGPFQRLTIAGGNTAGVVDAALADFDRDGDLDLAVIATTSSDDLVILENRDGTLHWVFDLQVGPARSARGLCPSDLDGDGDDDLAFVKSTFFPSPTATIEVLENAGAPGALNFTPPASIPTGGSLALDLAIGDFDGDSSHAAGWIDLHPDFVVVHGDPTGVVAFHGFDPTTSPPSFALGQTTLAPGSGPTAVHAIANTYANSPFADGLLWVDSSRGAVHFVQGAERPFARVYGQACSGAIGDPVVSTNGSPQLGNATFEVTASNTPAFVPAFFVLGAGPGANAGGCTSSISTPLYSNLTFTDMTGTAAHPLAIPNDSALIGTRLYGHWLFFDPLGFGTGFSASPRLLMQIGA